MRSIACTVNREDRYKYNKALRITKKTATIILERLPILLIYSLDLVLVTLPRPVQGVHYSTHTAELRVPYLLVDVDL